VSWAIAKPEQLSDILEFLKRREHTCVAFVAHLLRNGEPTFPSKLKKRVFYLPARRSDSPIAGLILQTAFGFVFPVLDTSEAQHHPRLRELSRRLKRNIFHSRTIMGRERDVGLVEGVLGREPDTRVTYFIMSLSGEPAPRSGSPPAGIRYRRATLPDLKKLLPLQAAYEEEEVIVDGREVNSSVVYHNMRSALEHHLTYIAERDGVPIAKASTNARGLTFDQIGGVYTVPAERNRGIASELMRYLIADIREQGKGSTLFVKKGNAAARAMYERLGFEHKNDFAISYYHQ
jgi:hypothetical protein